MNSENNHFNVVIATPGKNMVSEYVESLTETINFFNNEKISYCWLNEYSSHVAEARQRTFNSFYEKYNRASTYDKIIWIDSDISWKPEDIIRLINSDKEIITGAYKLSPDFIAANPIVYEHYTKEKLESLNEDIEIFHCGMGFLSIEYGIMESIPNPFMPINYYQDDKLFSSFNEDEAFCIKAKIHLNKKIWLDPKVKVNHHKVQTLGWD